MPEPLKSQTQPDGNERTRARRRYVLNELLAKGGMGVVYLARDEVAQRQVVYKRMWRAEPSQRVARLSLFRREYETLARLPHPNIVEVYDYGEDDEAPYYVMEHLEGADLAHAAPLSLREASRVLRDIASAIALVHTRRLVHRDVSPNNVRLAADGTAKLLDFGALTPFGRTEELVGTPGFIAPESFAGGPLDQRSDLYSLGALAYWTLTRRTPYGPRAVDAPRETFEHPPLPPSAHVPTIPRELDDLVLSLLATDPAARPIHASYVIDRLTSIAGLEPERDEQRVARSYLAHPPLCGRDGVLRAIRDAVGAAVQGRGSALLLEGEAGLGRSALVVAAAQVAQLAGMLVLRARGDGSAERFRLARTLIDAIGSLYPDLEPLSSPFAVDELSPQAAQRAPEDVVETATKHAARLAAARSMLLEASTRCPLALIIDDVHLADEESLALLSSLALVADEHGLLLGLSSLAGRSTQVSPSTAKLASSASRVSLAPLSKSEVGDLVQSLFGLVPHTLGLAHWLHAHGGGNPATTLDLMRLLLQRRLIVYTLGTFTLPLDVDRQVSSTELGSVVLARLGDLRPEVAKIALVLSLRAGTLTPEELVSAAELPLRDVLRALEELVERGVIARDGSSYVLLGSSLRAALEQSYSEPTRRTVHLALARTLLDGSHEGGPQIYDASWHLLHADKASEALDLLIGRAHRELAHKEAAHRFTLLELAFAQARRLGRSKEQALSLLLPLANSGFYGSVEAHRKHVHTALTWMSELCGMSLARRLRRYLGGGLALAVGLLYASLRNAWRPKADRLGSLSEMIAQFVALVTDSTALASACCDADTRRRFVTWLEPLAALPETTPGGLMRAFCVATSALAEGRVDRAAADYARLMPILSRPIRGMERIQPVLRLGTLNGQAIANASMGSRTALALADELGSDAFFSPFAEAARFAYHALRGEHELAAIFRRRAELLALEGGVSWAASSTLTQFTAFSAALTEDAMGLVHAISELAHLAEVAPTLRTYKSICEAWLEHLRGRSEHALQRFDAIVNTPEAEGLSMVMVNRALHAAVLNALRLYARAEAVCTRAASDPLHAGEVTIAMRFVQRERAVALAGLGDLSQAVALITQQLAEAEATGNPLELGASHRDRARIALLAKDREAFDVHYAQMEQHFHSTRHPSLRRQCDALLLEAERCGMRAKPPDASSPPPGRDDLDDCETYVEPIKSNG